MAGDVVFLVPYVLAVAMPSWRWLLAYVVAAALLLGVWFHGVMTTPYRTGLEVIGLAFVECAAISTASGTLVRAVTLLMKAHGRSGAVTVSILGTTIPFAILGVLVW